MKTSARRNRILLLYAALALGICVLARGYRAAQDYKSRPHATHELAGTIQANLGF